jgi:hypothetical protein
VQTALNAQDQAFLDLNWRVRNCSVSEFVFRAIGCRLIRSTRSRI